MIIIFSNQRNEHLTTIFSKQAMLKHKITLIK